jgi:hypothetical protein
VIVIFENKPYQQLGRAHFGELEQGVYVAYGLEGGYGSQCEHGKHERQQYPLVSRWCDQ